MGSECSPEEREFRYKSLYDAIHSIDNDIKQELKNTNIQSKKFCSYGLLNKGICKKYPFLLYEAFDSKTARNKIFNYKDLIKKSEDKDFSGKMKIKIFHILMKILVFVFLLILFSLVMIF